MTSQRTELPPRRPAFTYDLEHDGRRWLLTLGFDASGAVKELFLNGLPSGRENDQVEEAAAASACIALSHALQAGESIGALAPAAAGALPSLFAAVLAIAREAEQRDGPIAREIQTFLRTGDCQLAVARGDA